MFFERNQRHSNDMLCYNKFNKKSGKNRTVFREDNQNEEEIFSSYDGGSNERFVISRMRKQQG